MLDSAPAAWRSDGGVYLGLGSNLGDRAAHLQEGLFALADRGVRPLRLSSLYDTDPVGPQNQGNFLNLAAEVGWAGDPGELLLHCQEVERRSGRVRGIPGGPRTLDVDILL